MTWPHPTALGTMRAMGIIAVSRENACLETELATGTKCARMRDHHPFPHVGMWQGDAPESWTVTVWPCLD